MKRFVTLTLALLMLASAIAACGTKEEAKETTAAAVQSTEAVTTEDPYDANGYLKDALPEDLDFKDETVTVLYWSDVENQEFDAEELTGEIVNDAIFQRNSNVESRLHVKYNWVGTPGNNGQKLNYAAKAVQSFAAGDNAYDIYAAYSRTIGECVVNGLTKNLEDAPYIDYEKPWWPNKLLDSAMIHNHIYFISGDISTNVLHMMYCFYYNQDLLEDMGMKPPTDLVLEGKWTIDKLKEMCENGYVDVNGDGAKDKSDRFGCAVYNFHNDAFYTGSALRLVEKDDKTILKISDDFYSERAIDLLAKIGPWEASTVCYTNSDFETPFAEGRVLFTVNRAHYAWKKLRDSDITYGILPVPKYDENQEDYITVMANPVTLYSVSWGSAKPEAACAVLECAGSEAYRLTTPALFENNMKKKYSINDVNAQMYDIVRETVIFELGRFFNQYLSSITDIYFKSVCNNDQNWASTAAGYRPALEKNVTDLVTAILTNEDKIQ